MLKLNYKTFIYIRYFMSFSLFVPHFSRSVGEKRN